MLVILVPILGKITVTENSKQYRKVKTKNSTNNALTICCTNTPYKTWGNVDTSCIIDFVWYFTKLVVSFCNCCHAYIL